MSIANCASPRPSSWKCKILTPTLALSSYLIRPSPIHSRKLFMHRANSVRHADHSSSAAAAAASEQVAQKRASSRQQSSAQGPMQPAAAAAATTTQAPAMHGSRRTSASSQRNGDFNSTQAEHTQTTTTAGGQHQSGPQLRSYFSDGDFSEVLIKVDEHDDSSSAYQASAGETGDRAAPSPQTPIGAHGGHHSTIEAAKNEQRRRSSCSDVENSDSKRSSLA